MKNKNKQTKFPVARIKKIMQKDEEVGKVAQATPIVISKALELFLGLIIDEASKVTADRGSKKVEAYHLKHAVDTTEMLDFLKEIVEAVPDPSAGGTIDLESENAEKEKKKRGKGKRTTAGAGAGAGAGGDAPVRKRRKKKEEVAPAEVEPEEEEAEPEHEEEEMDVEPGPEEEDDQRDGNGNGMAGRSHKQQDEEDEDTPFVPPRS